MASGIAEVGDSDYILEPVIDYILEPMIVAVWDFLPFLRSPLCSHQAFVTPSLVEKALELR